MSKTKMGVCTVGYQAHTAETFLNLLTREKVSVLVDLREKPVSRIPGFPRWVLRRALHEVGVSYIWMGNTLGGFTCTADQWAEGCRAIATIARTEKVVMMCMERDYQACHRRKLARHITDVHGLDVEHFLL
jgi:uncharacterized protein (DUF488 family)